MDFLNYSPQLQRALEALGLTLLHSFWQGLVLMILLWALLRLIRQEKANLRFGLAMAALFLLLCTFAGTFFYEWESLEPVVITAQEVTSVDFPLTELSVKPVEPTLWEQVQREANALFFQLSENAVWMAGLWLLGSLFFSARLGLGLWQVHQLRKQREPVPEHWQQIATGLQQKLGIRRKVSFSCSEQVESPLTLGWLTPVILLPSAMLMAMPADQLESILVHELAHIRRHDYLWNLLQSLAEVVLFYHPAYWYMASVLEQDREMACDAITLKVTGRPQVYAQALLQVASLRTTFSPVALSARGSVRGRSGFAERIKRIVMPDYQKKSVQPLPFLLSFCLIGMLLFAFTLKGPVEENVTGEKDEPKTEDMAEVSPDSLRTPDYVGYRSRFSIDKSLPNVLSDRSQPNDNYIVGKAFSEETPLDVREYFNTSAVFLLDGEVVEDAEQIQLSGIRRYDVYHEPLPEALKNLRKQPYSTVVRALSQMPTEIAQRSHIRVGGQVSTAKNGKRIPVAEVLVKVQSSGEQTITDAQGRFVFPSVNKNDTILFYTPSLSGKPTAVPVDGREYLGIITHVPETPQLDEGLKERLDRRVQSVKVGENSESIKEKIIQGTVTDAETGQPLSGVKLYIKETSFTTTTESQGKYRLQVPEEYPVDISFLKEGYVNLRASTLDLIDMELNPSPLNVSLTQKQSRAEAEDIYNRIRNKQSEDVIYLVDGVRYPSLPKDLNPQDVETVFVFARESPQDYMIPAEKQITTFTANPARSIKMEGAETNKYKAIIDIRTRKKEQAVKTAKGRVVDATTGKPLPGTNILIKGTTTGTVSNREGEYSLQVPEGGEELAFVHIGYKEEVVAIGEQEDVDVSLAPLSAEAKQKRIEELEKKRAERISRQLPALSSLDSTLVIVNGQARKGVKSLSELNIQPDEILAINVMGTEADLVQYIDASDQGRYKKVVRIITKRGRVTPKKEAVKEGKPLFIVDGEVREDIKSFEELESTVILKSPHSISVSPIESATVPSLTEEQLKQYEKVITIKTSRTFDPGDIESRIQGKVVDADSGEPIEGVKITDIKTDKIIAVTDQKGEYHLVLENPKEKVFIMYEASGYRRFVVPACADCLVSSTFPSLLVLPLEKASKQQRAEKQESSVLRGQVVDAETGKPLPGINILFKGSTTGTVSNPQGRFQIQIPEGGKELRFLFIGYEEEVVTIEGKETINVSLKPLSAEEKKKELEELRQERAQENENNPLANSPLQSKNIQGQVVDAETGKEIPGANILIKGTTTGTVSDMSGRYSLQLPEDAETLVISFIGYAKKEVAVEGASRVELQNTDASQRNQSLTVFPNPGNQEVKVRFNLPEAGSLEFQLLDKEGGFLKSIEQGFSSTGEQEISIPVDELPADTYFLRVKLNGRYETRRVIVQ